MAADFRPVPYELPSSTKLKELADGGNSFAFALLGGRLVATVVSKKSGKHVAVQITAKSKSGRRFGVVDHLDKAERLFIDVPRPEGRNKEIGQLHIQGKWAGKILPPWGEEFDEVRLWVAQRILNIAAGTASIDDEQAYVEQGKRCLTCGQELTDPESIARNIGPTCWAKLTGTAAAQGDHAKPEETAAQIGLDVDSASSPVDADAVRRAVADELKIGGATATTGPPAERLETPPVDAPPHADDETRELFEVAAGADPREILQAIS